MSTPHPPIRHLASSRSGRRLAAAEFESNVHIWDIDNRKWVRSLHTRLDFGGERLAISADGGLCTVGSYNDNSVACYAVDTAQELWRMKVQHPQYVSFTPDDKRIVVSADNVCHILDRQDGSTVNTFRHVHNVVESPWGLMTFLSGKQMEIRSVDRTARIIPRETFAELAVAFSPQHVCVSESAGPVRCFGLESGEELWRYDEREHHSVKLCYSPSEDAFLSVDLSYEREGAYKLLRFDALSGQVQLVAALRDAWEATFCLDGSCLVTAGGNIISTTTGASVGQLWKTGETARR